MKLRDIPYSRPDVDGIIAKITQLTEDFINAESAREQIEIFKQFEKEKDFYRTYDVLVDIRNSTDTEDPFFQKEIEFFNTVGPKMTGCFTAFSKAVVESRFKDELRKEFGDYYFDCMENQQKTFCPEIMNLMAEENKLCTEYETLYASARIEFDGKICNVSQLAAYRQSPDRSVRKAAIEAEGRFFDSHKEQIEGIYDKLVKNRTQQAKILGFDSYVDVAYLKRNRAYSREDVAQFRKQILSCPKRWHIKNSRRKTSASPTLNFRIMNISLPTATRCRNIPCPKF